MTPMRAVIRFGLRVGCEWNFGGFNGEITALNSSYFAPD